jgi:hypothetical protein
MTRLRLLWLGLVLALMLAACAAAGSGDNADSAKNHGFYGGGSGGWTELHPQ